MIIAQQGISIFVEILQGKHPDFIDNVKAHRVAAKGLVNLALAKKETRH